MDLQPARNASFDEQVTYYKSRTLEELQSIVPYWAFGSNAVKMQDIVLRKERKRFIICLANAADIITKANFMEVKTDVLFTDDTKNDGRVARILHRWNHQQFVDPPTIGIIDKKLCTLVFSDGRHRTKVAYLLGCNQIPVAFYRSDFDLIGNILSLQQP